MGFLATLACAALTFVPAVERPKRLVIVSWDAGADWVVDRLLAEGKLPNLARMAREGVAAESMTQAFPSKTAVGHFTVFSGTWPRQSGVVNNSVPLLPRGEHTILETRSGFDANSHLTDPLWVTAAKAGKTAVTLSAAGSFPPGPDQDRLRKANVPLSRFIGFSGFEAGIEGARVFSEGDLRFADRHLFVRPVGGSPDLEVSAAPDDPEASSFKTFRLQSGSDGTLKMDRWSPPIKVRKGALTSLTYLRLFGRDSEGKAILYVRGTNGMQGTQSATENEAYLAAYGGFHDTGFESYKQGRLGAPLYAGGDGRAEERVVEIIAFDQELLKRSFRYALKRYPAGLYWHYTPDSDDAGHCWMGLLDPSSRAYSPAMAEKIWPYYTRIFQLQDDWLGDMRAAAGPQTAFALVSDHGMEGVDRFFSANYVLEKAGLLARDANGRMDLAKTKVCAPPWGDNQLVVNTTEWKGGIVPMAEKEDVLRAAERALLAAYDPETGRQIVTRIFRPDNAPEMGIGGPAGGDLYFDVDESIYPTSALSSQMLNAAERPLANGVHGFWPMRRKMQAIFYLAGPGVARGVRLPGIRAIDVAPTLCRLMGIPPSSSYQGLVIGQALK